MGREGKPIIHHKNQTTKLNQEWCCQKVVYFMSQGGNPLILIKMKQDEQLNQECYGHKVVYFMGREGEQLFIIKIKPEKQHNQKYYWQKVVGFMSQEGESTNHHKKVTRWPHSRILLSESSLL